ncbi:MAG: YdcF family protein [Chthoniobacterales bacterium]|jgi:uncharacterized SAM-binding protein YcdF (DUF218 family)|nr:YdcF family protein [Chthoniobacterales bacterium]
MQSSEHHVRRPGASAEEPEKFGSHEISAFALDSPPRRFWGILTRKERWGLSGGGWLILLLTAALTIAALVSNIYPFLAATDRVASNILVVEGWVHPYAIRAAVDEYRTGHYQRVFATGGPVVGKGGYVNDFQTAASVGADLLRDGGIPSGALQMVPSRVIGRDRTYSSAVALKHWFREHDVQVRGLNIVTEGAHARRSRLLFEEALGPDVDIGVISVHSPDFDARQWWYYSEGAQEIIEEGLGYLYAKFLFYPREADLAAQTNAAVGRHGLAASAALDQSRGEWGE